MKVSVCGGEQMIFSQATFCFDHFSWCAEGHSLRLQCNESSCGFYSVHIMRRVWRYFFSFQLICRDYSETHLRPHQELLKSSTFAYPHQPTITHTHPPQSPLTPPHTSSTRTCAHSSGIEPRVCRNETTRVRAGAADLSPGTSRNCSVSA